MGGKDRWINADNRQMKRGRWMDGKVGGWMGG